MEKGIRIIGIASDHAGFALKETIKQTLSNDGISFKDFGTFSGQSMDYPDTAHPLAEALSKGKVEAGIAICGSGNGVNMTVNKHPGVRGALCWTPQLGKLAREHNDANILSLPARFITEETALEIVAVFLKTPFEGGRHLDRVNKIDCR